ncbi:MAG: geranylgeranyl reductase family protein [Thermoplasmataceae archaeon]
MHDVLVVGSGPSGSYVSYSLARLGFDVVNMEEHREVGRPVECTGLVSERVFKYVKTKAEVNSVNGAHIFFPNGKSIHIHKGDRTIVMDRDQFDKDASAMAISAGADVRINSRVLSVKVDDEGVTARYRQEGNLKEIRSRIVVGADGVNSVVRKDLGYPRPSRVISTYQVDSAARMEDQNSVNVYVGSQSTHGFFGWATPAGELSKIGVGAYRKPALEHFQYINRKFGSQKILGINGGGIPIAFLKKTYGKRNLLVGDAAGIVKPLSGGGIFTGIVSARHASDAIRNALESEDFSENSLSSYQSGWKGELGLELRFDAMAQRFFSGIPDISLNRIYDILSKPRNIETINKLGDIDFPSKVILSILLRNPGIITNTFRRNRT